MKPLFIYFPEEKDPQSIYLCTLRNQNQTHAMHHFELKMKLGERTAQDTLKMKYDQKHQIVSSMKLNRNVT